MHGEVLARLDGLIEQQPGNDAPSPQAAFKKLLHGRSPYDRKGPPVSLAPFRAERLSLPDSVAECPQLSGILPGDALSFLEGYHERMLVSDCEVACPSQAGCFMDPVLAYNQKKYQRLVRMLAERHLVRFVRAERSGSGYSAS